MTVRRAAISLTMLALLAGCSSSAARSASAPSSTAAVTRTTARDSATTVHWKLDTIPDVPQQKCGPPPLCVALGTETGRPTGDLRGTSFTGNAAVFSKNGHFVVARTDVFRGTVKGCGSGSLVLVGTELADLHRGTGEWRVVEGFGTGDLARVTGHGTGTGTVDAQGYHSQWQGVIDCGK